jgi:hypothetical protein
LKEDPSTIHIDYNIQCGLLLLYRCFKFQCNVCKHWFLFHFLVCFDIMLLFYSIYFVCFQNLLNTYACRYYLPMEMFPCQYLNCLGVLLNHSSYQCYSLYYSIIDILSFVVSFKFPFYFSSLHFFHFIVLIGWFVKIFQMVRRTFGFLLQI